MFWFSMVSTVVQPGRADKHHAQKPNIKRCAFMVITPKVIIHPESQKINYP